MLYCIITRRRRSCSETAGSSASHARPTSARLGIFCGRTGHEGSGARFESGAHSCHATHQRCLVDDPPHDERVREGDELALWEGELRILALGETVLLFASREKGQDRRVFVQRITHAVETRL